MNGSPGRVTRPKQSLFSVNSQTIARINASINGCDSAHSDVGEMMTNQSAQSDEG